MSAILFGGAVRARNTQTVVRWTEKEPLLWQPEKKQLRKEQLEKGPDILPPDHSMGGTSSPYGRWALPLPGMLLAHLCYSDGKRSSTGPRQQERPIKKVLPFWSGPSLFWSGPGTAMCCWADVPIRTGPAGTAWATASPVLIASLIRCPMSIPGLCPAVPFSRGHLTSQWSSTLPPDGWLECFPLRKPTLLAPYLHSCLQVWSGACGSCFYSI